MPDDVSFRDLIQRIRAGDGGAAAELVQGYEPTIRMMVRRRLTDPALRRLFDSMDICQSVLASFFVRATSGQFELEEPQQLLRLLAVMARNKVASQAQKQAAARRDLRRLKPGGLEAAEVADPAPSPIEAIVGADLLREVRRRLSPEERRLAEERSLGRTWTEIAADGGESPDRLRMQLARAIDRVAQELQIED
jgi:RNA polymerase sigma-70 factor (ECF subfamily)